MLRHHRAPGPVAQALNEVLEMAVPALTGGLGQAVLVIGTPA
jgi:hypothetical protein